MKKTVSLILALCMVIALLPGIALANNASLVFTWAWDQNRVDTNGSATVVSWSGGSYSSYRSAFVVYNLPSDFNYVAGNGVVLDFAINSATLNNGESQAPTAMVSLLDGGRVKSAYSTGGAAGTNMLNSAKAAGLDLGTYRIDSTNPSGNALRQVDVTGFFEKNPNLNSVAIYLTNLASDGSTTTGIASGMNDFTVSVTSAPMGYNTIDLWTEEGDVLDSITVTGISGTYFDMNIYAPAKYYNNGKVYVRTDISTETGEYSTSPNGEYALYVLSTDDIGLYYNATRSGYSGSVLGSAVFIGTNGGSDDGDAHKAPSVEGVSHSGGGYVGSTRVGAIEFEVNSYIKSTDVLDAVLHYYVESANDTLGDGWLRFGFYGTENPYIENYTLGGMDEADFPARGGDYSSEAVCWSNYQVMTYNIGWHSVNIRKIIADALADNERSAEPKDKVRVVIRVEVPVSGASIYPAGGSNTPYLNIFTKDDASVYYDFSELSGGKVEDLSKNGFDGTLMDDAKIEDGHLILNGNGGVQIDYAAFREQLSSYTVITNVKLDGDPIEGSRIFDFGTDKYRNVYLGVDPFAAGIKIGWTYLAEQNMGSVVPFSEDKEYCIALSYNDFERMTRVYVDGEKVIETDEIQYPPNIFSDHDIARNFIGRTNWYDDDAGIYYPDIKAVYDDFIVYPASLDDYMIYSYYDSDFEDNMAHAATELEEKIRTWAEEKITDDLPFDDHFTGESGNTFEVTWYSSNGDVIDSLGRVYRTPYDENVKIWASLRVGSQTVKTGEVDFTVSGVSEGELLSAKILGYDFDGFGDVIYDNVSENNAAATGKVQKDGRANLSDGQYLTLPDSLNADIYDYTIAAYVRVDNIGNYGQYIYNFGPEDNAAASAFARVNANGTVTVGIADSEGWADTVTSSGALHEGEWAHFAVSCDYSRGVTYIYLNGVLDTASSAIGFSMADAAGGGMSAANYIGHSQHYPDDPDFVGKIDSFEFYSMCMSPSLIERIMGSGYDSPDLEIVSTSYIDGMDSAVVNIASNGFSGTAKLAAVYKKDGAVESVATVDARVQNGVNLVSVTIPDIEGKASVDEISCFLWDSLSDLHPYGEKSTAGKSYEFGFDYDHPDNNLLHNYFTLYSAAGEKYLSISGAAVRLSDDWGDDALFTGLFDSSWNAEGYYAIMSKSGTYLALDGGTVHTGNINNWRFERIGESGRVYALYQRSSNLYLASDGNSVFGVSSKDDERAWWTLSVKEFDTLGKVFASPGFFSLSANERDRIYGVTAQSMWQSSNRRSTLLGYIGNSNYFGLDPDAQAEVLRRIFSYTASFQINRAVNKTTTCSTSDYTLGTIQSGVEYTGMNYGENLTGYSAEATYYTDSTKTEVEQTITIYARNETALRNIAQGFSYIPYEFRLRIRTITDYYNTANQFNCGARDMYVRTSYNISPEGFAMTASHEVGHSLSFSYMTMHNQRVYINAMENDCNKVSGYGNSTNAEDFAEFTQYVISCSGDLELLRELYEMYPNRYGILRMTVTALNGHEGVMDKIFE